jgi:hypothetical protein
MKKIRLQKESTDSDTVSRDLFGGGMPPSSQSTKFKPVVFINIQ